MDIANLEDASPGDWFYDVNDQLKRHVYTRSEQAFAVGDAARDTVDSVEKLRARQEEVRAFYLRSVGGLPESDGPPPAEIVGVIRRNGFRIEKVLFQSRPDHYVTANLYVPDGIEAPRGAVLFVCGHARMAKHEPEYQYVCQTLVHAGLVVLAQDPIGQGERFSYYECDLAGLTVPDGTIEHDYAGAQLLPLGQSMARYFLHDSMRGVDYLRSRPEVDPTRIGITGNSGGGTQTSHMMLADPRIAAAAPGTFIMNRRTYLWSGGAQDAEQIWPGFSAAGFDHEDILLAMAPKPVRVLSVKSDFFPIEGTRSTVARCRRLWEMCGRAGDLDLVEDDSTHSYTPALARAAAAFFARHLLGTHIDAARLPEPSVLPPQELWCTPSGQLRASIPGARGVHDEAIKRLKEIENSRRRLPTAERSERAIAWLRGAIEAHRVPCDLNPRFFGTSECGDLTVQSALWWAQEGLFNFAYVFRDFRLMDKSLPVTMALWQDGTRALQPHLPWILETCASGRAALVLDVSGTGALAPRSFTRARPDAFYGATHKLATDLLWLGDDLPSLRTYDVLRALDMIAAWPGLDESDTRIYAHGRRGLYGRLAAALDPRIRKVETDGTFDAYSAWIASRHYDAADIYSVVMPGLLEYLDLPEL